MQEVIEKLKELIDMLEEKPEPPEKHRKFAAYWDELGRPELQCKLIRFNTWCETSAPRWDESVDYRIKDDPHWELRLKWVNSDKTLPIEVSDTPDGKWRKTSILAWFKDSDYREALPWYEQEISQNKPMLLKNKITNRIGLWICIPSNTVDWEPLTDKEIDALKRGF